MRSIAFGDCARCASGRCTSFSLGLRPNPELAPASSRVHRLPRGSCFYVDGGALALGPMNVKDLVRGMEAIAPTRLAASWDNVGLLVGDPDRELERLLLTIDCTRL